MFAGCYGSLGKEEGGFVAADWCPLRAPCSSMNLGWQENELNVDTLVHLTINLPLSISPSLALCSLWRRLYQQLQTKNDSSKSMTSSSSFLRRITGLCRGTLPPLGKTRNSHVPDALCIHLSCVRLLVLKSRLYVTLRCTECNHLTSPSRPLRWQWWIEFPIPCESIQKQFFMDFSIYCETRILKK